MSPNARPPEPFPEEKNVVRIGRRIAPMPYGEIRHSLSETRTTRETVWERPMALGRTSLSCEQLEGIISSTMDAIIILDEEQTIQLFNPAAEHMFECPAAEAIGRPLDRLISERFLDVLNPDVHPFGQTPMTSRHVGAFQTFIGLRADGEEFPIEASISQVRHQEKRLYTVVLRDITERKQAELKLMEQQASLRALAVELSVAEERERHRIAMGLHDNLGQILTVAKLRLGALLSSKPEEHISKELQHLSALMDQAIRATRSLTFELGCALLHELGLDSALQCLGEQFAKRLGIGFQFETNHQLPALTDEKRIVLFRFVRELLFNIEKHAHARNVRVFAGVVGDQIQITVEDDGVGFEASEMGTDLIPLVGFGLASIRSQLTSIGARVDIQSCPGHGTRATVYAPLE